jgi:hypothetical protein
LNHRSEFIDGLLHVLRRRVTIPHRDLNVRMPQDLRDRDDIDPALDHLAGRGMPEIVNPHLLDFRFPASPEKRRAKVLDVLSGFFVKKNIDSRSLGDLAEYLEDRRVHGDVPAFFALGILGPDGDISALEFDIAPFEREDFAFPHAGIQGDDQQPLELVVGLGDQPGDLGVVENAIFERRLLELLDSGRWIVLHAAPADGHLEHRLYAGKFPVDTRGRNLFLAVEAGLPGSGVDVPIDHFGRDIGKCDLAEVRFDVFDRIFVALGGLGPALLLGIDIDEILCEVLEQDAPLDRRLDLEAQLGLAEPLPMSMHRLFGFTRGKSGLDTIAPFIKAEGVTPFSVFILIDFHGVRRLFRKSMLQSRGSDPAAAFYERFEVGVRNSNQVPDPIGD